MFKRVHLGISLLKSAHDRTHSNASVCLHHVSLEMQLRSKMTVSGAVRQRAYAAPPVPPAPPAAPAMHTSEDIPGTVVMCHVASPSAAQPERRAASNAVSERTHAAAGTKRAAEASSADCGALAGPDDPLLQKKPRLDDEHNDCRTKAEPPKILLKIGSDGPDMRIRVKLDELLGMTWTDVLCYIHADAVLKSAPALKEVEDLFRCTVWLLPSVAGEEPTLDEEDAAVELCVADTLAEHLRVLTPFQMVCLRVRLPGASYGRVPFDESLGIPRHVWRTLPAEVQDRALKTHALRCELAKIPALMRPQDLMGDMWPAGVVNLIADAAPGPLQLGMIRIPSTSRYMDDPTGFHEILPKPSDLFLDEARVRLASEFLDAMNASGEHTGYGVLLSGPSGVGKSAVGLVTVLACCAQRLPVAYMSYAGSWVNHNETPGNGPLYLLQTLVKMNTDIFLSNDVFRPLFLPVLRGERKLSPGMMKQLGQASLMDGAPRVGIVLDHAHEITRAAEKGTDSEYFKIWASWAPETAPFVRMDIGTSHGVPELDLPRDKQHRLRYVTPWSARVRDAFLTNSDSPGFLEGDQLRTHVRFMCGGVVRALMRYKEQFLERKRENPHVKYLTDGFARYFMMGHCEWWLRELADKKQHEERRAMVRALPLLLRGEATLGALKHMYDDGLVERTDDGFVRPVSDLAASVLHELLAKEARSYFVPLSSLSGAARARELQQQLHTVLYTCKGYRVPVKQLNGKPTRDTVFAVECALPMRRIGPKLRQHLATSSVMYVAPPDSDVYAINVPKVPEAPYSPYPITVLVLGATEPRELIDKILTWFQPKGAVKMLAALFPQSSIDVVIFYDGEYGESKHAGFARLDAVLERHNAAAQAAAPTAAAAAEAFDSEFDDRATAPCVRVVVADNAALSRLTFAL